MCKIPTQNFFTNEFGLPLTMIPSKIFPRFQRLLLLLKKSCIFIFYKIIYCEQTYKAQNKIKEITQVACRNIWPDMHYFHQILIQNEDNNKQFLYADFEDMSCEMVYGQVPPPFEEDPVAKQPCFADICEFFMLFEQTLQTKRSLVYDNLISCKFWLVTRRSSWECQLQYLSKITSLRRTSCPMTVI